MAERYGRPYNNLRGIAKEAPTLHPVPEAETTHEPWRCTPGSAKLRHKYPRTTVGPCCRPEMVHCLLVEVPRCGVDYDRFLAKHTIWRSGMAARTTTSAASPKRHPPHSETLGEDPRVKSLRSSYTVVYPQSEFTRGCIPRETETASRHVAERYGRPYITTSVSSPKRHFP